MCNGIQHWNTLSHINHTTYVRLSIFWDRKVQQSFTHSTVLTNISKNHLVGGKVARARKVSCNAGQRRHWSTAKRHCVICDFIGQIILASTNMTNEVADNTNWRLTNGDSHFCHRYACKYMLGRYLYLL